MMKMNTLLVASMGLISLTAHPQKKADGAPLIPMEDFFRNPEKSRFTISPNGEYIAYLAPYKDRRNIFVQKIGEKKSRRITAVTDRDIGDYFWASDDLLTYVRDKGGDENFHLFVVDRDGKDQKDLTPFDGVKALIIDDLKDDPQHMIIGLNKRNPQVFDPYRIDLNTGEMTLLYENPGNITGWKTDHQGRLLLAFVVDGANTTLLYRETEEQPFQKVITTNFRETLAPIFFDFEKPNVVYALSNIGRDKRALIRYDLKARKEIEELFKDDEVDVLGLTYSRKRKTPLAIQYEKDKLLRKFLDKEDRKLYESLHKKIGKDQQIWTVGTNKNEDKFLVFAQSDRNPGRYYYYDLSDQRLVLLAVLRPQLKEKQLAKMKPVAYTTRDGLTIHGYLTLPVGASVDKLPVVVNPHGGPWARDRWGFNPEAQFLANRGYAVFQMNFRGSTGYGRSFWEKSFKQWGQAMQDDITDGVRWLIKKGIADPNRIAIYGGSYGGYATLAGIVKTPDLYACAVDYVGVSNLLTFLNSIPPYWEPFRNMMYEQVGDPRDPKDAEMMRQNSPALQAHKIKAPLFIAQGANDPRVNKSESDQMVEALKKRGVIVEYMVKDNEGHGFGNEENRFSFYRAMERFLAKCLGGRAGK